MTYEELLISTDNTNLVIKEKKLYSGDGRIWGNRIAIRKSLPTIEKSCVLAEELGHHHTTYGNIIDQNCVMHRKQERQARLWGYDKLIGMMGIIKAYERGCQSFYETAEYLEVTEEFLQEAIDCYRDKYGVYTTLGNYIIYFIPYLSVGKMI